MLLLLALHAHATVPELYGASTRSTGMGGGGVAMVADGTAAYVNPAGLSRIRRPQASVGFVYGHAQFDDVPPVFWDTNQDGATDDKDAPLDYSVQVDDTRGLTLAAGRHVGKRFGLGMTAYVPVDHLMRFGTFEPELPHYFMYSNRRQRYSFAAGVGGEIVRGVNVGASVDFVPKARYHVYLTVDATLTGNGEQEDVEDVVGEVVVDVHEMNLDVVPDFAPTVGIQLELGRWTKKLDGLVLGATWRGSVGLPIDVNLAIQANVTAEDIGDLDPFVFAAVLDSGLQLYDHYVPMTVGLGAAYRTNQVLSAYIDARWTDWRKMTPNVAKVKIDETSVTSPLVNLDGFVKDGNAYTVELRSVWSLRTGSELKLPRFLLPNRFRYVRGAVRGGFGLEPTPLVSQGASSALLDAGRTYFTLGAGVETFDPFRLVNGPLTLDLGFQYHVFHRGLLPHQADEPTEGFPVDAAGFPIGGSLVMGSAQFSFEY